MSARSLSNQAVLVGLGSKTVPLDAPNITSLEMQLYACQRRDAQGRHRPTQVGALFTGRPPMAYTALQWNMRIINELKIVAAVLERGHDPRRGRPRHLQYAAMAVAAARSTTRSAAAAARASAGRT